MRRQKRFLGGFLVVALVFTGMLFFVGEGDWVAALVFYILASIGNGGANVFYDSLLPHVARPEEIDQVSARGYAMGYLGGGLLLAVNLAWYLMPERFGFADGSQAVRASFLSVAVWWALFSIPLFRRVPEPPATATGPRENPVRAGFSRLRETFHRMQHYKELWKFLVAFWLYADGIGTIIKMAPSMAARSAIGHRGPGGAALLLTQFVGIPLTLVFGRLARRTGAKRAIYLALGVYTLISILGFFMTQPWHFWVLAGMVGLVQGGSQSLSRSLFGAMTPKARSAEFYGFFDISSKFAGIAGPLLFGLTASLTGSGRWSIVSLIVFFVAGALLLSRVNEQEGMAIARAENLM